MTTGDDQVLGMRLGYEARLAGGRERTGMPRNEKQQQINLATRTAKS